MKNFLSIIVLTFSTTLFSQIVNNVSELDSRNMGTLLSSIINKEITNEKEFILFGKKNQTYNIQLGQVKSKEELKGYKLDIFLKTKELAIYNYEKKEYSKCIFNYEISKKTEFKNAELDFVAGASYYRMYEQMNKQEYKDKAKRTLKRAEENGYLKAKVFLSKYFN